MFSAAVVGGGEDMGRQQPLQDLGGRAGSRRFCEIPSNLLVEKRSCFRVVVRKNDNWAIVVGVLS